MSDALAHLLVAVIAVFTALCSIVLISGGSDSRFIQSGIPSSPSPLTFPATSANFPSAMFDPPGSPWDGPELSQSPQPSGGCPLRLPETTPAAEVYALMVLPQPPAPRLVPFRHKILSLAAFFLLAVVAAINKLVHVQDFGRVCKRSLHSTIRRWSSVVSRCWVVGEIQLRKELPEWPPRLAGAIILDVSMLSLSCVLEHFRTVVISLSIDWARGPRNVPSLDPEIRSCLDPAYVPVVRSYPGQQASFPTRLHSRPGKGNLEIERIRS
ncbi:hypothetical protein OF83DRAFT_655867 [Amylostereum chailletii]|nr:hypothetical protein OF83DRAFT_655867 [Amylostereum chailletii]